MDVSQESQKPVELTQDLPLTLIRPNPFQARQDFNEADLNGLAESIREHGLLEPIRVRPDPLERDFYQLVYGERRLRASRLAGYTTIPCYIRNCTDEEMLRMGLTENLERKDLTPWETAMLFRQMLDQRNKRYSSIRKLAEYIGRDKDYVAQHLALLRLPHDVKELLETEPNVSIRALVEVAKLRTPEAREPIVKQLKMGMMSTEDVRTIVQEILARIRSQSKTINLEEQVGLLACTRALNRTKRRMRSAMKQLTKTIQIFQVTYGTPDKEPLLEYVQETLDEIQQMKEMLRNTPYS